MTETKQNIKEQIAELRAQLEQSESVIFVKSNDNREALTYKSLNEVKRFIEDNYAEKFKQLANTSDKKLNSKEFHALLSKIIDAYFK